MSIIMERAHKWIVGHDTGASSEAIWAHMMDAGEPHSGWFYPLDPADLGRCLRLLELIPEWKPRLPEMAVHSKQWAALVKNWSALEQSMANEVGIDWSKGQRAPKTYALMKDVIRDASPSQVYPMERNPLKDNVWAEEREGIRRIATVMEIGER